MLRRPSPPASGLFSGLHEPSVLGQRLEAAIDGRQARCAAELLEKFRGAHLTQVQLLDDFQTQRVAEDLRQPNGEMRKWVGAPLGRGSEDQSRAVPLQSRRIEGSYAHGGLYGDATGPGEPGSRVGL